MSHPVRIVAAVGTEIASRGPTCVADLGPFGERWRALRDANPQLWAVAKGEGAYPANLACVGDAPPWLFVLGTLLPGDSRAVSLVGTRRASPGGLRLARTMSAELAEAGMTVVSGLARGIDAAAHRGALAAGGRTVAVLGSGLCCVYPPQHGDLATEVAGSGAVVSQWWPWMPPSAEQFRRRNAVTSGLALATVVIEASARSGARIQGRLALSQGRLLLLAEALVIGEPWARALVEKGSAQVVGSAEDVLGALGGRTLVDDRHREPIIHQSSGSRHTCPLQPGQAGQLRLDIG